MNTHGPAAAARPRRRPQIAWVQLDGEAVLYDEESGDVHVLNPTGAIVWECLDGSITVAEVVGDLEAAYGDTTGTIRRDVMQLVTTLADAGLLVHTESTP